MNELVETQRNSGFFILNRSACVFQVGGRAKELDTRLSHDPSRWHITCADFNFVNKSALDAAPELGPAPICSIVFTLKTP